MPANARYDVAVIGAAVTRGCLDRLPPHQLPIRHPMRLIRIRPLPLLQIFYIGLKIPLELRATKRGYDAFTVAVRGEILARRVVRLCHTPTFVTMLLVTERRR